MGQGRMYEDANRWGYLFQSYVLLTMMELHHTEVVSTLYWLCYNASLDTSAARYIRISTVCTSWSIPATAISLGA